MTLIATAAIGRDVVDFAQGAIGGALSGSTTTGGDTGEGRIGGRSLLAPSVVPSSATNLSRGSSTIVLQAAPIYLDGEVVGRAIERRVTARSNRRGALGIF